MGNGQSKVSVKGRQEAVEATLTERLHALQTQSEKQELESGYIYVGNQSRMRSTQPCDNSTL